MPACSELNKIQIAKPIKASKFVKNQVFILAETCVVLKNAKSREVCLFTKKNFTCVLNKLDLRTTFVPLMNLTMYLKFY